MTDEDWAEKIHEAAVHAASIIDVLEYPEVQEATEAMAQAVVNYVVVLHQKGVPHKQIAGAAGGALNSVLFELLLS